MDRAERAVAVLDRVDDDADADEVLDVVELLPAHDHLLVDRPVVLRASLHLGLDVQVGETVAQLRQDLEQLLLALGRAGRDHLLDLGVPLRVQHREREVLELPLHVGDAEPVRERRVDVDRLLRDPPLLRLGQRRDRAHVVQPVGELDQQDPDVLGHRHEHLAQRRGLLRLLRVELEPVELGDAVDDGGDLGAELGLEVLVGERGVLDRVVQQRAGDRHVVEAEVGEDHRHAERVRDVGLARPADLLGVGGPGDVEGLLDELRCRPGGGARGTPRAAARARPSTWWRRHGSGRPERRSGRSSIEVIQPSETPRARAGHPVSVPCRATHGPSGACAGAAAGAGARPRRRCARGAPALGRPGARAGPSPAALRRRLDAAGLAGSAGAESRRTLGLGCVRIGGTVGVGARVVGRRAARGQRAGRRGRRPPTAAGSSTGRGRVTSSRASWAADRSRRAT